MRLLIRLLLFFCLSFVLGGPFCNSVFAQEAPQSAEKLEDEDVAKDATTEINVKDADISAIIRIFSKKTKRNYILDERVKGKVSIYLPGKVSADESLRILDSVLALKGFTSVPIGENLWKIVPSKEAKQSTVPVLLEESKGPASPAIVTRLIGLKYVTAEDIQQLLAQLISPDGLINAYTGTNSLIVVDSEDNIKRLLEIVAAIDVPSTDRDMSIIPVKFADAVTIAEKLNDILGTGSGSKTDGTKGTSGTELDLLKQRVVPSGQPQIGAPGAQAGSTAASYSTSKTVSARVKEPKITADERTNSVIVVADEDTTARVKALISQLDTKTNLAGNKFYVYRCEHAKAEELANVLAGLAGGGGGTSTSSRDTRRFGEGGSMGDLFTNTGRSSRSSSRSSMGLSERSSSLGIGRSGSSLSRSAAQGSTGAASVMLGENISITADPATNSLIIVANKADYEKILSLLKEIDIKRRQVIVEAMLLEVGVEDSQALGTSFLTSGGNDNGGIFAESNLGSTNLASIFDSPSKISGFTSAAASSGTLTLPNNIVVPSQIIMVHAASKLQNVNVLSAPTILATDNEPAKIIVGQNVPFLASTSTSESNLNNTFNQIDRQDVGISLEMTPQISSGSYVTMNIFTEVSSIVLATITSPLGPTTTKRQSETTVIAKDGQMIVIGGLMSDDVSEDRSGVPFLEDVPVLGHLFRDASAARKRTNLLIFITPRIVKDQYDARDVSYERSDLVKEEIKRNEVFPSRREVLENKNLDKVTEIQPYDGAAPSTILAKEENVEELVLKETVKPLEHFRADSPGVIELKVNPKLPSAINLRESNEITGKENSLLQGVGGERFVVMELYQEDRNADGLPFNVNVENGQFGLLIPEEAAPSSREFFKAGQAYAYEMGGITHRAQALGIFRSREEAQELYPGLSGNWYTLSPFEIMGLGKKPWLRQQFGRQRK